MCIRDSIYGAQSGAGGVILVTTKKAKEGKTSLSYDATFGVRKASNVIEPLNAEEQLEMRKLSYANAGLTLPTGWDLTKKMCIRDSLIFASSFFHSILDLRLTSLCKGGIVRLFH